MILPGMEIDRIEYPQLQKEIRPDADAKSIRLDVYVKDDKNTVYNIEMQAADTKGLPKRCRYYQGMLDLQMIDRGADLQEAEPQLHYLHLSGGYFWQGAAYLYI